MRSNCAILFISQSYSDSAQTIISRCPLIVFFCIKRGQISIDFISLDLCPESQQSIVFERMRVYIILVLLGVALLGMAEAQQHRHHHGGDCHNTTTIGPITANRAARIIEVDDDFRRGRGGRRGGGDDDDFRRGDGGRRGGRGRN